MKAIIFANLLICLLAVGFLDNMNALARQDPCTSDVLNTLKPQIDAKLEQLEGVITIPLRSEVSRSRLR